MNESLDKLHSFQKQPEALRLADDCDAYIVDFEDAAVELRRLHEVNQELLEALRQIVEQHGQWNNGMWAANIARAAITKATGGAI